MSVVIGTSKMPEAKLAYCRTVIIKSRVGDEKITAAVDHQRAGIVKTAKNDAWCSGAGSEHAYRSAAHTRDEKIAIAVNSEGPRTVTNGSVTHACENGARRETINDDA